MASVKSRVKGKVSSGLKKLSKKADWIGAATGYLGTIISAGGASGVDWFNSIISSHTNAVYRHNTDAVTKIVTDGWFIKDGQYNGLLLTGIGAAIVGSVVKLLPGIVPYQGTVANIVAKAGFGMVVGSGAAIVLSALAYGSSPFTSGNSSGGSQPGATTSGRIPMSIKYNAGYPSSGRVTWERPHG